MQDETVNGVRRGPRGLFRKGEGAVRAPRPASAVAAEEESNARAPTKTQKSIFNRDKQLFAKRKRSTQKTAGNRMQSTLPATKRGGRNGPP